MILHIYVKHRHSSRLNLEIELISRSMHAYILTFITKLSLQIDFLKLILWVVQHQPFIHLKAESACLMCHVGLTQDLTMACEK